MSIPVDNDANQTPATPSVNTTEPTLEETISEMVSNLEDKNFKLPDDIDPVLKYAVMAEKRRRDTQATYTRTNQALKRAEAERAELLAKVNTTKLSDEQLTQLEELKHSDPDAYYNTRRTMEAEADKEFKTNLEAVSVEVEREMEIERRSRVLEEFNAKNNVVIDDDVVNNDIPPRFLTKLDKGEVTFEQFLQEVLDYLNKPANTSKTLTQPNLNNIGGGAIGDYDEKVVKQATEDAWTKVVF